MYRKIVCILLLFLSQTVTAQTETDSLRNILKQHTSADSVRVQALVSLSNSILYTSPDSALQLTEEALNVAKKTGWQKGMALAHRQQGMCYYSQADYTKALDCYHRALKQAAGLNDNSLEASVYNCIGNIYADMEEYDKALDYYHKDLAAAKLTNNPSEELIVLSNIAAVYTDKNELDSALHYFLQSHRIAEHIGKKKLDAALLNNIAIVYKKKEDYTKAIDIFNKSLTLCIETENKNAQATALNGMAQVYILLNDYSKAENYSLQSLELSKELKQIQWQTNAYQALALIYEKQKKYEQALYGYKNYVLLRDSVMDEEKKSEITQKEMQFEFEKKEALAKAELSKQKIMRNAVTGGAAVLLIAAFMSFIFYRKRTDAIQKKKEAEFRSEVSETEMKALRAQMNPHFIFNSLNSVTDFLSKNDVTAAENYLMRFAKVMRMILENSEQKEISLSEELRSLELYMQLESQRLKNKFSYEIKVDESIDKENTVVPPLILQPFVENSIWHGISPKPGNGKINIEIRKEGDMIICIVEDNGVGRRKTEQISTGIKHGEKKSIGMKITRSRIDILNRIKKSKAAVELFDLPEGLRVEVKLPLSLSF